jgi:tetratricopeptide (TPR) repeat protein
MLKYALRAIRLDPDSNSFAYRNAAWAYMALNRLDEAKVTLNNALERNVGGPPAHFMLSLIALARGDKAAMEREDALFRTNTGAEYWLLSRDGSLAGLHGVLHQSRILFAEAKEAAQRVNLKESAISAIVELASLEANYGYPGEAERTAAAVLGMSPGWYSRLGVARTLALVGNERQASALIKDVASRRAEDTWVQSVWVPGILAIIQLNHRNPEKALELLNAARPYDRADFDTLLARGVAYLKAGRGAEAAHEYQKVLDLRNFDPANYRLALAQLGVARSYVLQGDNAKARTAYQDLLALWKDADPDVPLVKEARSEYAKLQ